MAAAKTCTWDIAAVDGGARRPTLVDVGGATLEDEDPLPDVGKDIYADAGNQWERQIAAIGKVVAACGISVKYNAGVASVYLATGPGAAIVPGVFTVTQPGTGLVQITWPAGTLPPTAIRPVAMPNSLTVGANAGAVEIANGVQVQTAVGTVATNLDFTVFPF